MVRICGRIKNALDRYGYFQSNGHSMDIHHALFSHRGKISGMGGEREERSEGFRFRQNARLKGCAARGLFAPRREQCKQWPGRSAAVSPGLRGEYNYIMNSITI